MKTTRQRATEWIRNNFKVVEMFETFALALQERGRCFGINLLRERVRWECVYEYGEEAYKFPNEFSPYVARFLLWLHPDLQANMVCHLTKDESEIQFISAHDVWPELFSPEDGPDAISGPERLGDD